MTMVATSKTKLSADNLRRMRLGLGMSLPGDGGYFGFDSGNCFHGQRWWFNEYDADPGAPLAARTIEPSGLYKRVFTKGVEYVNPASASLTVALGSTRRDATIKIVSSTGVIPAGDARIFTHVP
jgi:hypothetical protein